MNKSKGVFTPRKLAVIGMMLAITIVLCYTPLGIIPLQPVSATIMHIPTIIIAIVEGPIVGLIVALFFGIASMIKAITMPASVLDPLFANPLISVLPRVLIAITSYYCYVGLQSLLKSKKLETISVAVASAIGSLTNTIGSMGMLYLIYGRSLTGSESALELGAYVSDMASKIGINFLSSIENPIEALLIGIILTFGLMEMIAAVIIVSVIVFALKKFIRK